MMKKKTMKMTITLVEKLKTERAQNYTLRPLVGYIVFYADRCENERPELVMHNVARLSGANLCNFHHRMCFDYKYIY